MKHDEKKVIDLNDKTERANLKAAKKNALKNLKKLKKQIKHNKLAPDKLDSRVSAGGEPMGERLPYPGGFPVYLSRYVIMGGVNPRAALRFFNASDVLVTGIRFKLTERDKDGKAIAEYVLERSGLFAERGGEFAVTDVKVSENCVSVEARLTSIFSEKYEYAIDEKGEVTLGLGRSAADAEVCFKQKPICTVKKKGRKYILISLIAVIGITAAAGAVAWRIGVFDSAVSKTSDALGAQTEITCTLRDKD